MKKLQTTFQLVENKRWSVWLTKNEDNDPPYYSLHDIGEPCTGLLKHWDTLENHIEFFERILKELKKVK